MVAVDLVKGCAVFMDGASEQIGGFGNAIGRAARRHGLLLKQIRGQLTINQPLLLVPPASSVNAAGFRSRRVALQYLALLCAS